MAGNETTPTRQRPFSTELQSLPNLPQNVSTNPEVDRTLSIEWAENTASKRHCSRFFGQYFVCEVDAGFLGVVDDRINVCRAGI